MDTNQLIEICYEKALVGLKKNTSEYGLLAASADSSEGKAKSYAALYTRDIGISAYGILSAKVADLYPIIQMSLTTLTKAQSPLGQFPFYYKPEEKKIQWRDMGSIDSTLWWCIAFLLYYQTTHDENFFQQFRSNLEKAFTYLAYQDVNNDTLLEQQEASDWADEMPRRGMVLYTNTLWYWALDLYEKEHRRPEFIAESLPSSASVKEAINTLFWIHKTKDSATFYLPDNDYTRKNVFAKGLLEYLNSHVVYLPYYLGYVSHKSFEARCDSLGNVLTCLTGIADTDKTTLITDSIIRTGMNQPYPLQALYPVIYPGEPDWRDYMTKGRQNYPHQYHNGGLWPFIGAFWVQLLSQTNNQLAKEELAKLAKANSLNNFEFNEYLQGVHGTPMGVPHQSWNMSMYLAAYHAVHRQPTTEDTLYTPSFHLQKVDEEE